MQQKFTIIITLRLVENILQFNIMHNIFRSYYWIVHDSIQVGGSDIYACAG